MSQSPSPATLDTPTAGPPPTTRPGAATKRSGARRGVAGAMSGSPALHHGVLTTLRDLIVHSECPPGARLTERVLCEQFQVSRTPLREALKVLAHEGLVELLPNRGARVTRLTAGDARHLFETLGALESLAGRLACLRATDAELQALSAAKREMAVHYAARDLPEYFRLNQEIHEAIVLAARNPVLAASHGAFNARLRRARYAASQQNEVRWAAAMREHEELDEALTRRAADEVSALLSAHLQRKCEAVCEQLPD